jgi:hypothetical protein
MKRRVGAEGTQTAQVECMRGRGWCPRSNTGAAFERKGVMGALECMTRRGSSTGRAG